MFFATKSGKRCVSLLKGLVNMGIRQCFTAIMGVVIICVFMVACSNNANPLDELDEWDLVYISDSTGWGVADRFAENIERDTGKTVRVHSYAINGLPALKVLNALRSAPEELDGTQFESLHADIAEAEVIVFFGNPRGESSQGGINMGGLETCLRSTVPSDCSPELYAPYTENLKAVYEEILALRDGKPTIIRAVDFYNPIISSQRTKNVEAECTACWETFNLAVLQAAEAYNIPLVSVYDAFNGPNHDEDPRGKGYIVSDGVHASEEGQQVIADILSEAGYEPIELPSE
jgi:hypothetical protein